MIFYICIKHKPQTLNIYNYMFIKIKSLRVCNIEYRKLQDSTLNLTFLVFM